MGNANKITLNISKSYAIIIFPNSRKTINIDFLISTINSNSSFFVNEAKYLGRLYHKPLGIP